MHKEKTLRLVYRHPLLTEENFETISNAHREVRFRKGDFFLHKGDVSGSYLIMESGLMRSFVYSYDGDDH